MNLTEFGSLWVGMGSVGSHKVHVAVSVGRDGAAFTAYLQPNEARGYARSLITFADFLDGRPLPEFGPSKEGELTSRQREGFIRILTRIAGWTSSRWDQHLRGEIGDGDADVVVAWLIRNVGDAAGAHRNMAIDRMVNGSADLGGHTVPIQHEAVRMAKAALSDEYGECEFEDCDQDAVGAIGNTSFCAYHLRDAADGRLDPEDRISSLRDQLHTANRVRGELAVANRTFDRRANAAETLLAERTRELAELERKHLLDVHNALKFTGAPAETWDWYVAMQCVGQSVDDARDNGSAAHKFASERDDLRERLALCQQHRDEYLRERDEARQRRASTWAEGQLCKPGVQAGYVEEANKTIADQAERIASLERMAESARMAEERVTRLVDAAKAHEAQLAERTRERDAAVKARDEWARQCNMKSEDHADLMARVAELAREVDRCKAVMVELAAARAALSPATEHDTGKDTLYDCAGCGHQGKSVMSEPCSGCKRAWAGMVEDRHTATQQGECEPTRVLHEYQTSGGASDPTVVVEQPAPKPCPHCGAVGCEYPDHNPAAPNPQQPAQERTWEACPGCTMADDSLCKKCREAGRQQLFGEQSKPAQERTCGPCAECPADGLCETQAEQPLPTPATGSVQSVVEAAKEWVRCPHGSDRERRAEGKLCDAIRALDAAEREGGVR